MRWCRTAVAVAVLVVCGCGGGAGRPAGHSTAASEPACAGSGVELTGRGRIGVVLLPQSGGDACQWNRFAHQVAARGMRAVQFSWEGDDVHDALGAVAALRRAGARRIALVGASLGGHVALVVAARRPRSVGAVVTLSAERTERSDPRDAARLARRIRIPSLTIGSRNDGWTTFGADTRAIHRAIPARVNVMRMVGGDAHGVDLLTGRTGAGLTAEIMRFVQRDA